ncbi:MAG: GH39 family glycosyl hydrolase, partial [Limisphaerales bacterium]
PDISALSALAENSLSVMVWNYHDDDIAGPAADIDLILTALPLKAGTANLRHFRIDENHSNAFAAWKRMGSPQQPMPEKYEQLEKAGRLAELGASEKISVKDSVATVKLNLPRQGVSLVQLSW